MTEETGTIKAMEHDLQRVSSRFGKEKGLGFLVCHWIVPLSVWSDAGFSRKEKQCAQYGCSNDIRWSTIREDMDKKKPPTFMAEKGLGNLSLSVPSSCQAPMAF